MLLFFAAGTVQGLVLFECVLRRVLALFVPTQRSALGRFADKSVMASASAGLGQVAALPLQVLVSLANISASVLVVAGVLVVLGVALSDNTARILATATAAYNGGVAPLVNAWLEIAVLLNSVLRFLLPVYNVLVYVPSQFVSQVVGPIVWQNAAVVPEIIGNAGLGLSALVLGAVSYVRNLIKCSSEGVQACAGAECGAVFVEYDMNCVANPAFLSLDLMTPGVYMRRVAFGVQTIMQETCAVTALLTNVAMLPLLDFNLYKTVHCVVNIPLQGVVSLVLGTLRRCEMLKARKATAVEVAVGCTPDWLPLASLVAEALRSLGRLVDNWLNGAAALALEALAGQSAACDTWDIGAGVAEASAVFGQPQHRVRVVGLTEGMVAVTDGESAMFRRGLRRAWASFVWPFPVRVTNGVAAVTASLADEERTGLLGCECLDEAEGIVLACATVPLLGAGADEDAAYNASHTHNVDFSAVSTVGMRCARTMVRVLPLRFSKRRVSTAAGGGRDAQLNDAYGLFSGGAEATAFVVDAAIYVQPLCGDAGPACLPLTDACYPWCMGLHVAGVGGQNISVFNAVRWEEYVSVRQTDCGVELDDGMTSCEAGGVEVEADGRRQAARCGLAAARCTTSDQAGDACFVCNVLAKSLSLWVAAERCGRARVVLGECGVVEVLVVVVDLLGW